jgi:hypothetical protein
MTPFRTGEDLTEWQECRQTIGRLDTTIADLRKFSFSLVTVLITASGFLGQQASGSQISVSVAIMILIASLFAVCMLTHVKKRNLVATRAVMLARIRAARQ